MDTQSSRDLSALVRAVEELTTQIAQMKAELSEIKQISSLTKITLQSYYEKTDIHCQEKKEEQMQVTNTQAQVAETQEQYQGRDKYNPPLVPEGTELTCVRCNYKWVPHARRPQLCPGCKTPWWFPPKWRWHQSQTQSQ